jgi:3-oxoacyl-[acyl-carrier protein] reductase
MTNATANKTWLLAGIPQALSDPLRQHLQQQGDNVACAGDTDYPLDSGLASSWDDLFANAAQSIGPIDALIIGIAAITDQSLEQMTLERFRQDNEANIVGNFLGVQAAFRAFKGRGGHIITLASAHARRGQLPSPSLCAASNGISMLTRTSAIEGARETPRIHVNGVLAGNNTLWPTAGADTEVGLDEIVEALVFLGGPGADYMTGALVPVGAPGP